MSNTVFATSGTTESGDDLPILLWSVRPTAEMVDAAYRERLPEEYSEVGFVSWTISEAEYV